jgi:hypothetical protein
MMLLAPVTNWEPHVVMLTKYCYGMRHGMKVQIITAYRVSHLQRYGVTVRGNVTSVYLPFGCGFGGLGVSMLASGTQERGAARSEWFWGHPRDGRTLRAIWGRPAGCRGLGRVEFPQEMTEEHKHKRRTKGRAT